MIYKNILIVKLSAIGDVIHALPVAQALKTCFPQAKVSWVVEKAAYDLLTNNPYIDELILFEKQKFKSIGGFIFESPAFIQFLRSKKYDLALDLQGLLKSGLIAYLSGASKRLVYENAREGSHLLSERVVGSHAKGHVVERYLDVVRALGCSIEQPVFSIVHTQAEIDLTGKIASQAGFQLNSRFAVLILGANWPNKIWPYQHYAHLCNRLWEEGIIPILTGSQGERKLAEQIIALTEIPPVDLTGKTSLKQLAYVLKKASVVVGGDTGPMHLAAAVGSPVIALMGPTDIERNGPYGKGHVAIVTPRDCAGCWQRQCPKQLDCLDAITPQQVYDQIQKTLVQGENDDRR